MSPAARLALLALVIPIASGCPSAVPTSTPGAAADDRVASSLRRAEKFLLGRQSDDGAWRSDLYGQFNDGTALTPLVMQSLLSLPPDAERDAALDRGAAFLGGRVRNDGAIDAGPSGLPHPVYTSAGAVEVLSDWRPDRHRAARDAWLSFLRERQLTERLGWAEADWQYGGWGYCPVVPRKPAAGQIAPPMLESNLSATVFALRALRAANVAASDPVWKRALVFVRRCQNFDEDRPEPEFDDGGFYFIHGDPVRNKAGSAGRDATGRERFRSYGSATADGLLALRLCGEPRSSPRVERATAWLKSHHDGGREAVYFYFHRSTTEAFGDLDGEAVAALLSRQGADGSWANPVLLLHEDEPLVATSFAVQALAPRRSPETSDP